MYLKGFSVYLVATTRFNSSPSQVLNILNQISKGITDFCGVLTEESIRKNFVLIYELIDEMVDFGYPQLSLNNQIEKFIVSQPISCTNNKIPRLNILRQNKLNYEYTLIPITEKERRNEIFVDVIENLHVLFNSSNIPICQFVDGKIKMKSYLTGIPTLKMSLNIDSYFDDYNFHECVDDTDFNFNRRLVIQPPSGNFNLMSFRMSRDIKFPFKVYPTFDVISPYKVELNLKIHCELEADAEAKQVILNFTVP